MTLQHPKIKRTIQILLMILFWIGLYNVSSFMISPKTRPDPVISTYEECVAAGNPVLKSYPGVCIDGADRFTQLIDTPQSSYQQEQTSARTWQKPEWLEVGASWQRQLEGEIDQTKPVDIYDIDYEIDASVVKSLQASGKHVICYVNVGASEAFRNDYNDFPKSIIGESNGWEGENWLDIREIETIMPLIEQRFDLCKDKGFDAIEPDNVDVYKNYSGFDISADDQLKFNRMIADAVHNRGLAVGLKNDLDQIPQLVNSFDFAVNEQCVEYNECDKYSPFINTGKPVFHAEYRTTMQEMCVDSKKYQLSSILKDFDLAAPIISSCN